MSTQTRRLTNVSNPASFGIEWTSETGTLYQMANPRGTRSLYMGARPVGRTNWVTQLVSAPERFGLTEPPTTFEAFQSIVQAFLDGAEEGNETP